MQCARLPKLAKDSAVKARTQAINQLKAVLVTADPDLRRQLAGLKTPALVRACTLCEDREDDDGVKDAVGQATRIALCRLAQRIGQLTRQIRDLDRHLTGLVERHFPQLLVPVGIGPDGAVALPITMGDNPERLSSEFTLADSHHRSRPAQTRALHAFCAGATPTPVTPTCSPPSARDGPASAARKVSAGEADRCQPQLDQTGASNMSSRPSSSSHCSPTSTKPNPEIVAREAVLSGLIVTRTVLTRASATARRTNALSIALA